MNADSIIAFAGVAVAVAALLFGYLAQRRANQVEDIRDLLGDKETVAFAALKLRATGLPKNPRRRKLTLEAMMAACVFTTSDRARALLYDVIDRHRDDYRNDIRLALTTIQQTFGLAQTYNFPHPANPDDTFDLSRGMHRIQLLEVVLQGDRTPTAASQSPPQTPSAPTLRPRNSA